MPVTTASGKLVGGSGVGVGVEVGDGVAEGTALVTTGVGLGDGLTLLHPARTAVTTTKMTHRLLVLTFTPLS